MIPNIIVLFKKHVPSTPPSYSYTTCVSPVAAMHCLCLDLKVEGKDQTAREAAAERRIRQKESIKHYEKHTRTGI